MKKGSPTRRGRHIFFFFSLNKVLSKEMHALLTTVHHRRTNGYRLTLTVDKIAKQQRKLHSTAQVDYKLPVYLLPDYV